MSKVYGFCDMNCKYEVPTKEEFDALVDEIAYSPVEANVNGVFTLDQVGIEYVMYRKNKYLNNWGIKMVIHNSLLGDIDINPDNTCVNTMDGITYTLNAVPLDGEYIRYKVSSIEYKAISSGTSGGGTEHLVYTIQYKTENTSWQSGQVAMSVSTAIGKDNIKYGGIKITQGVSEVKIPPIVERNFAVLESTMFDSMKKFEIAIAEMLSTTVKAHVMTPGVYVIHDKTLYNDVYIGDAIDDVNRILKIEGGVTCSFTDSTNSAVTRYFDMEFHYNSVDEDGVRLYIGKGEESMFAYNPANEFISVYLTIDNGNLHFSNGTYYNKNDGKAYALDSLYFNRLIIYFK